MIFSAAKAQMNQIYKAMGKQKHKIEYILRTTKIVQIYRKGK